VIHNSAGRKEWDWQKRGALAAISQKHGPGLSIAKKKKLLRKEDRRWDRFKKKLGKEKNTTKKKRIFSKGARGEVPICPHPFIKGELE